MTDASGIAANRLLSFVERIENLLSEKQEIADQIKEVKAEAKSAGFDVPTINTMIKRRAMDAQKRQEQEDLLDTYEHAIGQLKGTPLADAAAPKLTPAQERLKSGIDNLTQEPGTSISITSGGVTTKLENKDGTRILTQTGEPTVDLGPPTNRAPSPGEQMEAMKASPPRLTDCLAGLKQQMRAAG